MARGLWPCLEPHVERSPPVCLLGLGHARLTGRRFPVWWRHLFANLWCMPGCHARELARSATVAPAEAWVGRCCRCCADAVWRWERRTVRLQSTEPETGGPHRRTSSARDRSLTNAATRRAREQPTAPGGGNERFGNGSPRRFDPIDSAKEAGTGGRAEGSFGQVLGPALMKTW